MFPIVATTGTKLSTSPATKPVIAIVAVPSVVLSRSLTVTTELMTTAAACSV